jgi:hypothetical protein
MRFESASGVTWLPAWALWTQCEASNIREYQGNIRGISGSPASLRCDVSFSDDPVRCRVAYVSTTAFVGGTEFTADMFEQKDRCATQPISRPQSTALFKKGF